MVIHYRDEAGQWQTIHALRGERGPEGPQGEKGADGYQKPSGGIPVSDLEPAVRDTVQAVSDATHSATGGTLMKRTSTGAVSVASPTAGVHAANRNYVDDTSKTAAKAAADAKIQLVKSLPASPDPTVLYLIAG